MIGITLAYYGIGTAIIQGGLIRLVIPRFGEPATIIFGLTCGAFALFLFAFASETWMILVIIPISCLSHLAHAAFTGMMTKRVPDSEQGELQGVLGSLTAVASFASPLMMTAIFFALADPGGAIYLPGGPFAIAGILTLVAFWPLMRALAYRG